MSRITEIVGRVTAGRTVLAGARIDVIDAIDGGVLGSAPSNIEGRYLLRFDPKFDPAFYSRRGVIRLQAVGKSGKALARTNEQRIADGRRKTLNLRAPANAAAKFVPAYKLLPRLSGSPLNPETFKPTFPR